MPEVLARLLILLWPLIAGFGYLVLHRTENVWLRPLVEALQHPHGSWIKRLVFKAASFLAKSVLYVERQVRASLSHAAAASLGLITGWLNSLAALAHYGFAEVEHLGNDVADALGYLVHHRIPAMIHAIAHPIDVRARAALGLSHRSISLIRELDHRLSRGIDRLRHEIASVILARLHGIDRLLRDTVLPRVRATERAIGGVIARDIPGLRAGERALEREALDLRARIGRIEKALGLGLLAGVVYKILARVAPWLFCRNVNQLGRAACGLDSSALNGLLGLLLGLAAIEDLETLARFTIAIEDEVAKEVKSLLNA
jgi:hypothetical protein